MTDSDGSSDAAQGAQPTTPEDDHEGFFDRLFGWNKPDDEAAPEDDGAKDHTALPGLSRLRQLHIADVAIPKGEIESVSADSTLEEVVDTFRDSGFTRLPVYDGTLDTPLGMVHLKDVALKYGFNGDHDNFDLKTLVRPLLYAPPSMPVEVLMQKMQSQRMHMALVIDEYGGTDGLVTIEDMIEEVVGEIEDEHDVDEDQPWTEESPGCYVALARAPLDEFSEEIGVDLSLPDGEDEADTLGGIVFLLVGRVPARGEVVTHPTGVEIEVVDADPRRLKRLRLRRPEPEASVD